MIENIITNRSGIEINIADKLDDDNELLITVIANGKTTIIFLEQSDVLRLIDALTKAAKGNDDE